MRLSTMSIVGIAVEQGEGLRKGLLLDSVLTQVSTQEASTLEIIARSAARPLSNLGMRFGHTAPILVRNWSMQATVSQISCFCCVGHVRSSG